MSYWIEMHCDANLAPDCSGLDHDTPMTSCATVEHGRSLLLKEAKRRGWKRIGGDMYCKACVQHRASTNMKGTSINEDS